MSYRQEKRLEHTWKPCLTFYCHQIVNILYYTSFKTKGTNVPGSLSWLRPRLSIVNQIINILYHSTAFDRTYLEAFLDGSPGFLLWIRYSISYNVPSNKWVRTYLEALLDFLLSSIVNILYYTSFKTKGTNVPGSLSWLRLRLSIVNQIINILYHNTAFDRTYLETFLDGSPGFLLWIRYSISYTVPSS